jgi:hypothetical protein
MVVGASNSLRFRKSGKTERAQRMKISSVRNAGTIAQIGLVVELGSDVLTEAFEVNVVVYIE